MVKDNRTRVGATYGGDVPDPWITFASLSPLGSVDSLNAAFKRINPDVEVTQTAGGHSWKIQPRQGVSMTRAALAKVFLDYARAELWVLHSEDH